MLGARAPDEANGTVLRIVTARGAVGRDPSPGCETNPTIRLVHFAGWHPGAGFRDRGAA